MSNKSSRFTVRISEEAAEVLEELRSLGANPSELVRDLLQTTLPGLRGMARAIRAKRQGVTLSVPEFVAEVTADVVKGLMEEEKNRER